MDIHKPQPWRGWPEFLKEIGTIVIGVLIALGGEQAVEWSHRQAEIREARDALRAEIERDLGVIEANTRQDVCMRRYMQRLTAWAEGGPTPPIARLAFNGLASTTWDVAKTGAVAHMPLSDRLAYANLYDEVALYQTLVERERSQATEIFSLYRMGTLTPQDAHTLRLAVNGYDGLLRIKIIQQKNFDELSRPLGMKASPMPARRLAYLADICAAAGPALSPPA